jgi:hypothetical protein
MPFFRYFPTEQYSFVSPGTTQEVTNIFRNVDAKDELLDDAVSYQLYTIRDGERPDVVSQKIYGDPDYYWSFFVVNNTLKNGLKDWPLSNHELERYLELNFDPYSVAILPGQQSEKTYKISSGGQNYTFTSVETDAYVGGLDLSQPFLRIVYGKELTDIYRIASNGLKTIRPTSENGVIIPRYKIGKYDEDRFQLWCEGIPTNLLTGVFSVTLADGTNLADPAVVKWIKDFQIWTQKHRPAFYQYLVTAYGFSFPIEEIAFTIVDDEKLLSFAGNDLSKFNSFNVITFDSTSRSITATAFIKARNAPHHYVNEKNEVLTLFDAFNGYNYTDLIRVSYAEYVESINSSRTTMRVVKPANIREFAKTYRDLITS